MVCSGDLLSNRKNPGKAYSRFNIGVKSPWGAPEDRSARGHRKGSGAFKRLHRVRQHELEEREHNGKACVLGRRAPDPVSMWNRKPSSRCSVTWQRQEEPAICRTGLRKRATRVETQEEAGAKELFLFTPFRGCPPAQELVLLHSPEVSQSISPDTTTPGYQS